ncbi:hypothetical protein SBOR_4001 [Sclerotinia borealis F-4128]|uniref:DNA-binding protein RAP1 n=1 Tax=Sclerotinia borealis (strain F-4128) TaxID=1432307 RepID=W9CM47_SCLBF|nr:hypothetical protein SBOR_4001 [Sclerotinia borealis F-4128]
MASIVYDGVGGGGTLFAGMKFFILQRVPMRPRWIELIQSNGGEVTKFEKKADILIADGARKDVPPGSVSWNFIEESAKAGKLVDIEKHRCGAPAGTIREQGSAQPAKTTRTPYTAEDDRLLTKWVLKAERMGRSTKGNQIYMEFETLYPRHTFQSWLDHWKKVLLPRHEAGRLHYEIEDGDSPSPERQPKSSRREPVKPPATKVSHDRVQPSAPKKRSPVPASSSPPKHSSSRLPQPALSQAPSPEGRMRKIIAGRPFTEEDDSLLRGEFVGIHNLDPNKEIEAWETWAELQGYHTAQEWRNYFYDTFSPKELKAREKKLQAKNKPALSTASRQKSSSLKDEYIRPSMRTKHSIYKADESSLTDAVRSPIAPPTNARSSVNHETKAREAESRKIDLEKRPYTNSLLKEEDYFTYTLKDFSGSIGFEPGDLNLSPKIRGKEISIFKLWQIVMLFGGFKKTNAGNRWQEIADRLGFPIAKRAKAAEDLKNCYDEILHEFEIAIAEAENDTDNPEFTASQEETMIASQLEDTISRGVQKAFGHEGESEVDDEDLDLPPPLTQSKQQSTISTKKRAIDSDNMSNHSGSSATKGEPQTKRRKVDKGKGKEVEIPSTPEHIFNATQLPANHQSSPLKHKSSPLKSQFGEGDGLSSSDHEARERVRRIQQDNPKGSSRKVSAKNPILEPETQDFHYTDIDDEVSKASPTPAPKKITTAPVIDLSGDLPTESEPEPESESQNFVEVEINKYIALGYSEQIIFEAINVTTYVFELASVVMEQLKMGHSIPDNMVGVWTERDDEALFQNKGAEYERIRMKHGDDRIAARRDFKESMRDIEEV